MPTNRAFVFDSAEFKRSIDKVGRELKRMQAITTECVTLATVQFAEHFIGETQLKAPHVHGRLKEAATVQDPIVADGIVTVVAGYNLVYAAMRDQGTKGLPGGVLRPVRAKMLFIPLREGARPGDKTLVRGVDFVLAKEVRQKGSGYFTLTFEEMKLIANRAIGTQIQALMKEKLK